MSHLPEMLRRVGCVLIVVTAVAVIDPGVLCADQADDDYLVAQTHYKKQRWKDAAEAFQLYLRKHDKHRLVPFARFYLGVSLENQEEYAKARKVLRGFAKDYPKNRIRPDALFRIGECSYFLNDLKAAETELSTFLTGNAKHDFAEFALPYLGDVQYRLNKPRAAAKTFQLSLSRFEKGRMVDDSKFGLAHCHVALKQPDKAIELFREMSDKTGSSLAADAQMELGSLLFDQNRNLLAAKTFDAFGTKFAKHPEQTRSLLNAGYAYYRLKEYKTAIDRFEKAAADKSLRGDANYWRALSHKSQGEYKQAITLLKAEFENDEKHKRAPAMLYEWATCERFQGESKQARARYLDFVKRWAKHEDADDALYFAAELALLDGDAAESQKLVDRFRTDYPKSDIWPYRDLLQARIHTAGKDKAKHREAEALLRGVIAKSTNARSKLLARFHLLRTLRLLGNHKAVVKESTPLLNDVLKNKEKSEFIDALLLISRSQLEQKSYKGAISTASSYLTLKPNGDLAAAALGTRMTAAFHADDAKQLLADADRLLKEFPKTGNGGPTVHRLAEAAYGKKDWDTAAALFRRLTSLGTDSKYHGPALSGLGWAQFEAKKYAKASTTFGQLLKDHGDDRMLASQAAYKQAECDEMQNRPADAAAKYQSAFEKFAPETPAAPGDEQPKGKYYYAFQSGLKAARLLAKQKDKTKQADAVYEKLFTKFPKPKHLDRHLDEWALINYNAGDYKRSDEIFRRLIKDVPKSPLVDNARYSLAESDLNAGKVNDAKKEFVALYTSAKSDDGIKEVSLFRLIGISIESEDWKAATKWAVDFQKTFSKSRHRSYAAFSEAEARFHQNEYKAADAILAKLRSEPADSVAAKSTWYPRVWLIAAESANQQAKYADVLSLAAEAKKWFGKWKELYLLDEVVGRSYKRQAKFKEAREAFARVTAHAVGGKTRTGAKCQFLIADTFIMQDDYKSARKAFFRVDALYAFPQWQAPALYQAAQCEEKLKDFAAAVKTYQDLISRFPKSKYAASAKSRLATAKKRAGK